jgi:predicted MFS family arabinose efflux permease
MVVSLAIAITSCAQGAYNALHVWLPTYYRVTAGISIQRTTEFILLAALGSIAGSLVGAALCDILGRRRLLWLSSAILSCIVLLLLGWRPGSSASIVLNFLAGFVPSLMFSAVTPLLSESLSACEDDCAAMLLPRACLLGSEIGCVGGKLDSLARDQRSLG